MNWITITIIGYTLLAVEAVMSKYILAGRMKGWRLYTFYVGLFSLFTLVLSPFGLKWGGTIPFLITFFSGIIFYISLGFLFSALLRSSTERVYTLQGASITLLTLLFSFLLLGEIVYLSKIIAIVLLVIGGFFISFKFYRGRFFSGWQKVIIAALLSSVSLIMLKYSYNGQSFITGYVFNRMGIFSGALLSLAVPAFRREILNNWKKKSVSQNTINLAGTIIAKTIAGIAMLLINYGIYLGSVSVVCALVSVQYLLTFAFVFGLSFYFRKIFVQHMTWQNIFSKIVGIALITAGTILVFL
ncbi:MAG: hypothetical protein Q8L09_01175 [Candidatus Moranbacteria bacterium]|nr:hypothetical protein [Candidatus Moranbacteria bacterium]